MADLRELRQPSLADRYAIQRQIGRGGVATVYFGHEKPDSAGTPTGDPQAPEVDCAFGIVARWRGAPSVDNAGRPGGDVRGALEAVARFWAGVAEHAAGADFARCRLGAFCCGGST